MDIIMKEYLEQEKKTSQLTNEINKMHKKIYELTNDFVVKHCPIQKGQIIENQRVRIRITGIRPENYYGFITWKAYGQKLTKNNKSFKSSSMDSIQFTSGFETNGREHLVIIEED